MAADSHSSLPPLLKLEITGRQILLQTMPGYLMNLVAKML